MMTMQAMILLILPVELICDVLERLTVKELLQCTMVSKRLNKIIFESSSLQFSLELAKFRMKPPSAVTLEPPFAARLQLLRNRERAWRTLTWTAKRRLKLAHTGAVYEFAGGMYGNGKENDRRNTISITLYDLPTLEAGTQNHRTHSMEGLDIVDFTMDPSQDLLVLVSLAPRTSIYLYELHLRSMTTNEAHPLAAAPVFSCMKRPEELGWIDGAVRVQISGPLVGFLIKEVINSVGGHFEVFNWRAGGPPDGCTVRHASGIDDFIFLSQKSFLLVRPSGMFEVYSFEDPGLHPNIPTLKACYAFPALSEEYNYWYICLSSNPAPGYSPGAGNNGHNKLYYPSPEERLHACCIYVFQPILTTVHTVFSFVFFFRSATFLRPPDDWVPEFYPQNSFTGTGPGPYTPAADSPAAPFGDDDVATCNVREQSLTPGPPPSTSPSPPPSLAASPNLLSFPTAQPAPQDNTQSTLFQSPAPPVIRPVSPISNPHVHGPVYRIPWEVWGPKNTRWFRECLSKDWQHSVYGLRTIECITDKDVKDGTHNGPDGGIGEADDGDGSDEDEEDLVGSSPANTGLALPGQDLPEGGEGPPSRRKTENETSPTLRTSNSPASISPPTPVISSPESQRRRQQQQPVLKHLRLRDFNPYNISLALEHWERECGGHDGASPSSWHEYSESSDVESQRQASGKQTMCNASYPNAPRRLRRIVTEPSKVDVRGVFKGDIDSHLPYVEVVTEKEFDTTEVMMDDCRMLLLKRGRRGKLKSINILSM